MREHLNIVVFISYMYSVHGRYIIDNKHLLSLNLSNKIVTILVIITENQKVLSNKFYRNVLFVLAKAKMKKLATSVCCFCIPCIICLLLYFFSFCNNYMYV